MSENSHVDRPSNRTVMDAGVITGNIAQRHSDPMRFLFECAPVVALTLVGERNSDCESQLERHVEPRNTMSSGVRQLYTTEIVQREPALRDDVVQPAETIFAGRDLQYGSRRQPKTDQAGNQREKDTLVFGIEGEIDEDVRERKTRRLLRQCAYRAAFLGWRDP
jgi:hypothetical protein